MRTRFLVSTLALLALGSVRPSAAQEYRNIVNNHFNTVSNGPLQSLIVDVPNAQDGRAVQAAIAAKVNAARGARAAGLQKQMDAMRRMFRLKGTLTPGIPDIVMVREKGKLLQPVSRAFGRAGNDLVFNFPISAAPNDGGWTTAQAQELAGLRDKIYPVLKTIYGDPAWSGTVTVIDADNQGSILSDPNALSGGVYDVANSRILFAQYNSTTTKVFNLAQMMAIAFHGPDSISYDAWERGMARAATMEVVRNIQAQVGVAPDNSIFHVLDRYDLLNQPPLGNDRFFPASKVNGEVNTATFPLMLVPRLMMSGSAWLKAQAESPGFLAAFNSAYYSAAAGDPTIKNNVQALKNIAAGVLPTVEGVPFDQWYRQQYVLDTAVTPGVKLYADARQLPATADDPAFAVILYYYQTFYDANGGGDEKSLNGTSFPIYWDYLYSTRLFLAGQYERVDIRAGIGTVAPTFPNTITPPGGDASLQGRQRITMDFPVNAENVRLYVAPRDMGTETARNNFWGVVVGASTGSLRIQTDTGVDQTIPVKQGSWGVNLASPAFTRPSKATLTFTDADNHVTTRQVNIGYDEYIAVLYAADQVQSLTHTFTAGPAMISFPIQPLNPLAELALLNPATDQPLFTAQNLLLAQWRQNLNNPNGDNYLRYPTLEPLTPGKGYWENFSQPTTVKIKGRVTTPDQDVSIGLMFGWNQIGTPYQQPVNISDLRFQYLADTVSVDLATAITRGWVKATTVPSVGQVAIFDYDQANGYVQATTLAPWKGYWICVTVSEGLTITYPNPTPQGRAARNRTRAASTRAASTPAVSGWSLPLLVRGPDGRGATVWLGQSPQAEAGANLKMNALRPPDFTRAVPAMSFPHPELGQNAGDYITEIKHTGSKDPWEISVYTPDPTKTYTLSWANLNGVPRTTRLVLVDKATGQRQYLGSSSGYSFVPGSSTTRSFQIVSEDRTRNSLRIFNVMAQTTRATGAVQISYELSQGATVTAEIRASNGRLVRRLNPGRAASSGVNSAVWDARDDKAMAVPAGSYMVQIKAQTPEGESTRIVQPFTIVR